MRARMLSTLLLLLLSGGLAPSARAQGGPSATAPHLTVSLVVPPRLLVRGQSFVAGIDFKLERGWHVYWLNAGDSGEPPHVSWTLPAGISADPIEFPAPKRLPLGPLMDFGYEGEVVFPVPFHIAPSAAVAPAAKPATLGARVNWLVCREVCIPGKAMLSVARPVAASSVNTIPVDAAEASLVARFVAQLPSALPPGAQARFSSQGRSFVVQVPTGHPETKAQFFPYDQAQVANAASQTVAPVAKGLQVTVAQDENLKATPLELHGLVVVGSHAYEVHASRGALSAIARVARPDASGLVRAVGLALLGGALLNLMPCVFPVLFIKGLSLVQSSREDRGRMRRHGWVYTLGILVSFWAVVGLLLGLRAAGHQFGWGFQFQSPTFLGLMASILFFLALSLAGMFEIGLSLTSAGGSLANKGGYAGSFFTGVLAMVVATPCTAPFMGAAIGYALAASAGVSFAVFTALALGLAAPYLLLAYNPGWTRLLPRPGAWMEVLKQAIAVPIFATVIWLVWLYTQVSGANALLGLLGGFLLLAITGWILGRWPAKLPATVIAIIVLLHALALPIVAARAFGADPIANAPQNHFDAWVPFTPGVVEKYRAQGKPVLIDFTAKWCLSCQVNERVVLDRADVEKRLRESGVALVRADWTRHDESIGEALAALGRSGIPAYALYPAAPGAPAELLPEVLTPGILYSALDGLKSHH